MRRLAVVGVGLALAVGARADEVSPGWAGAARDSGRPEVTLAAEGRAVLEELRQLGPDELAGRFLEVYERSASIGPEKFTFDAEGRLATTSVRVALLDNLLDWSERLPDGEVAKLSAAAMGDPTSTLNERMVAVRNVAVSERGLDSEWLAGELRALLATPEAFDRAPFAVLQALDGVVASGDADFVGELDRLAGAPQPALARAAAMTLDRLATGNSVGVARLLNDEADILVARAGIRADLLAKVDPGKPAGRRELERYLRRSDVDVQEKARMLRRLRQPAYVVADGIFTVGDPLPEPPEDWDTRVAAAFEAWRKDETLRAIWPLLEEETGR